MRVLFSSTWGAGHIFPMVPLARAFRAQGHDVRWATSNESRHYVSAAGIETVPAGLSRAAVDDLVGSIRAGMTGISPEDKAAAFFPRGFAAGATPAMLADLLTFAREWQPDLLVHDHAELAAPLVGAVLGVPSVTHAYGGAIPVAILDEATERLAPMWAAHGLTIPPQAGCFTTAYLDICPTAVQTVATDHIPTRQPLRPVVYTGEPSAALPDVLTAHDDPLVYVTLGTNHQQSAHEVAVLHSVIDSLEGVRVRILVTVGPHGDPSALGAQPSHVTVERFVSQSEVLPRATAVVSHAGSGTVLGALGEGLPQVCLPQAADQFRNSLGVTRSGAGLSLHPDDATPQAIGAAVRRILVEEQFREAALGIADDIRAMPAPEAVLGFLTTRAGSGSGE